PSTRCPRRSPALVPYPPPPRQRAAHRRVTRPAWPPPSRRLHHPLRPTAPPGRAPAVNAVSLVYRRAPPVGSTSHCERVPRSTALPPRPLVLAYRARLGRRGRATARSRHPTTGLPGCSP